MSRVKTEEVASEKGSPLGLSFPVGKAPSQFEAVVTRDYKRTVVTYCYPYTHRVFVFSDPADRRTSRWAQFRRIDHYSRPSQTRPGKPTEAKDRDSKDFNSTNRGESSHEPKISRIPLLISEDCNCVNTFHSQIEKAFIKVLVCVTVVSLLNSN